jgi:UDP-N-acetylmuramate dehydrogenase
VQQNFDLTPYNTFGLTAHAANYVAVSSVSELQAAIHEAREAGLTPVRVLGGGSNVLISNDLEGLTIHNRIESIQITDEQEDHVLVAVSGGHNWHQFVLWAVENNFGGVENMSLIPGSTGASPVQNIGAYGVELKDVFVQLTAIDLQTGDQHVFNGITCQFGYRDSIFKRAAKGRFCIVEVVFRLTRQGHHNINVSYGDIHKTLIEMGVADPKNATIRQVSDAVIHIRSSKLPDPAQIGNCGSFFKNPETERSVIERIRVTHPQAPAYDLPNDRVKIPAGWLIEQCGWKGKRVGNTGSYAKQALVLVNYGGAKGEEVRQLAHDIIQSVHDQFGVALEPEVNIW